MSGEWLTFFEIELGETKKLTESDKKKKSLDLRKCYCDHKTCRNQKVQAYIRKDPQPSKSAMVILKSQSRS